MGAKLQALHDLQDIESQIVDIQRQISHAERKVKAQRKRLQTLRDKLAAERDALRHDQARVDELDLDIKSRTANIEKLREHLNSVRTNKEYAAVLQKMNNEKADSTRVESQAMEIMEAMEAKRTAIAASEGSEQVDLDRLSELEAELEQSTASFSGRLAQLDKQKAAALDELDAATVVLFDRLSQRYDGEVLAEVQRPNPRLDEFVCGGCHMSLQPDVGNSLRLRDDVVTCKSCGRILFIAPQT